MHDNVISFVLFRWVPLVGLLKGLIYMKGDHELLWAERESGDWNGCSFSYFLRFSLPRNVPFLLITISFP